MAMAAQAGPAVALEPTSCVSCHVSEDFFDTEAVAMVTGFAEDVHASVGLSCHDCHGGNPDPALADDLDAAMNEDFAPHPYEGTWSKAEIPGACGRCHSDLGAMRRFRPDMPVDQESEYWQSRHGLALAEGDERVATCTDCHGTHRILRGREPDSSVHPTKVAETCRGCHADAERMAGALGREGTPVSLDQYSRWRSSVHAEALLERDDLSAPTCNDCHGNHGAVPPGVDSLGFVCGSCHPRESQLFLQSGKFTALRDHEDFLADGETTCGDCHTPPDPAAEVTGVHAFLQCAACHRAHDVVRPTVAMLAPLPDTPCALCHEAETQPLEALGIAADAVAYDARLEEVLGEGAALGLTGSRLFDWLVDRSQALPDHRPREEPRSTTGSASVFDELFRKLRIGKTEFRLTGGDPDSSRLESVVRCSHCHASEPSLGAPEGLDFSQWYLGRVQTVASEIALAERLLLRARRGGVATRGAQEEIAAAVDDQIAAQALFHTFTADPEGELALRLEEATASAIAAAEGAQLALIELRSRRLWLAGLLALVLVALVGLGIKIRTL
ncbi:MAG: cytochrome c3 family protein, partial [Thermoanaerobaculia bacterium]|nr:cytochrome c3 family protein [Thermoanaerobaculia bacterium]